MPSPTCSTDSHKLSRTYVYPAHRIATDHNVAVIVEASRRYETLSPSSQVFTNMLIPSLSGPCGFLSGGSNCRRLMATLTGHYSRSHSALRCIAVVVQASKVRPIQRLYLTLWAVISTCNIYKERLKQMKEISLIIIFVCKRSLF